MFLGLDQVDGKDLHFLHRVEGQHQAVYARQAGGDAAIRHLAAADDAVAILGEEFVRDVQPLALEFQQVVAGPLADAGVLHMSFHFVTIL